MLLHDEPQKHSKGKSQTQKIIYCVITRPIHIQNRYRDRTKIGREKMRKTYLVGMGFPLGVMRTLWN